MSKMKIKKAEKLFRTGTVVSIDNSWAIISQVDKGLAAAIDIETGNRWNDPVFIEDGDSITIGEIERMVGENEYFFVKERLA